MQEETDSRKVKKTTVVALQQPNTFTNPKGTFLHPSEGDNWN